MSFGTRLQRSYLEFTIIPRTGRHCRAKRPWAWTIWEFQTKFDAAIDSMESKALKTQRNPSPMRNYV